MVRESTLSTSVTKEISTEGTPLYVKRFSPILYSAPPEFPNLPKEIAFFITPPCVFKSEPQLTEDPNPLSISFSYFCF